MQKAQKAIIDAFDLAMRHFQNFVSAKIEKSQKEIKEFLVSIVNKLSGLIVPASAETQKVDIGAMLKKRLNAKINTLFTADDCITFIQVLKQTVNDLFNDIIKKGRYKSDSQTKN